MNQPPCRVVWRHRNPGSFQKALNSIVTCSVEATATRFIYGTQQPLSLEVARLGMLDAIRYSGQLIHRGRRGLDHIRQDRADDFLLVIPLTVPVTLSQAGRNVTVDPGRCVLLATAKPFEATNSVAEIYSVFVVRLPGSVVRKHASFVDECCAKRMEARRGSGKILRAMIETIIEERDCYSSNQAERYGSILLSSIGNFLLEAPELGKIREPQCQPTRARIFEKAKEIIESHLSSEALNPAFVAAHCGISVSYLHAIFALNSQCVTKLINEYRLERIRDDLSDHSLRHQSIIQIAIRWGFRSSAAFSRAYRARFGTAPSCDRAGSPSTLMRMRHVTPGGCVQISGRRLG